MMGDPGTSDSKLLYPTLGIQEREKFHVQAPGSALEPSEPSLHHHSTVSLRPAESEAWSNRGFDGVSVGHHNCAPDPVRSRPDHSEDTFDVMPRARVGEGDLLTFPEGEGDAVTITARDLASLQPGKFLTDDIVDFYLKYLKVNSISSEHQNRFHFFNSFFFRRLLETTASLGVDECRVDYSQLRKWVGDVNLFEKDFIFVPVIASSHWSVLVICHLWSLNPSSLGERKGSPLILHLDPIEGKHEPFEAQVKSFILQAWVERFGAASNFDILHSLFQMKYVQAKVPQQGNGYDCGLYILHYIEVFLSKSTLHELIISSFEGGAHFIRPNFGVEVLDKRNCIQRIILHLCGMLPFGDGNDFNVEPLPQEEDGLVHYPRHQHQGLPKVVKEMKSMKWKEMETLVLLQCMVVGGRFSKGKLGVMHWDQIAEEINGKKNGGPLRSKEQCQNRFDTLLKAYKDLSAYCLRMGKEFCQVTEEEKRLLKLATPFAEKHEEWYNHLHTIYKQRFSLRDQSHKRRKLNANGDVNKLLSTPMHPSQQCSRPLDLVGISKSINLSPRQIVVQEFNKLEKALRLTFLNLIQVLSFKWQFNEERLSLEDLCRMLAIVQDHNPLEIRKHVYQLQDLKLVTLSNITWLKGSFGDCWIVDKWLEISDFEVYEKFRRKVLSKNPHLNTFLNYSHTNVCATNLFLLQQIRVLALYKCYEHESLNLENFPHLCYLEIGDCPKLKQINGWKVARGIRWIEISNCHSYCNVPDIQFLSSLKEFSFWVHQGQEIPWQLANFNHCIQLRKLMIGRNKDLVESMDLKALRFLEVLSFSWCTSLSTIHGLSGLHTLMKLNVEGCESLKVIPDLGYLKALTYLDMSGSGIMEIHGLEQLHLLTSLSLDGCKSLESLPPLGHLKALAFLSLAHSGIEEISGVEDLVNLETLYCEGSKLKCLPNLGHLRQLHSIDVDGTPLFEMDPSRSFIRGNKLIYNHGKKEGGLIDGVSDISDTSDFEDN